MKTVYPFVDVEPCLAKGRFLGWDRYDPKHWICERKYDGERRVCQIIDGIAYFTGRRKSSSGERLEKGANLFHLRDAPEHLNGAIFDGEIYIPGATSTDVTAILSCKDSLDAKKKILDSPSWPQYAIFDIIAEPDREYITKSPLVERIRVLENLFDEHIRFKWARFVHLAESSNFEQGFHKEVEGVVLKDARAAYVYGVCGSWVKVKHIKSATVSVVGFQQGEGKYANTLGALIYGGAVEGKHVRGSCSGMTDRLRDEIWQSRHMYLNLKFDVEYARISDDTLVQARFDRWRLDL